MKFNEGVWNPRENIKVCNAVEISQLSTHLDDSASSTPNEMKAEPHVRALCTTRHIKHRGDLINKPTITVTVTSPAPGIIGVEAQHFLGRPRHHEPSAHLFPEGRPETEATVELDDHHILIRSGHGLAYAQIDRRPESFSINFYNDHGEYVTALGKNSISWVLHAAASPMLSSKEYAATTIQDPYYRPPAGQRRSYMAMAMTLAHDEKVYGLGERFGPFIKNGQIIESSNDDGGASSDSGKLNTIPFKTRD